jgi:hypothetical protein
MAEWNDVLNNKLEVAYLRSLLKCYFEYTTENQHKISTFEIFCCVFNFILFHIKRDLGTSRVLFGSSIFISNNRSHINISIET